MVRSRLRLDLKPLDVSAGSGSSDHSSPPQGIDLTPEWWLTEIDGPFGPQRWEFGSRSDLEAHLAARGLSPDQIDELWAQQEISIEDHQAVAAPMWQRANFDQHAE